MEHKSKVAVKSGGETGYAFADDISGVVLPASIHGNLVMIPGEHIAAILKNKGMPWRFVAGCDWAFYKREIEVIKP